jgi:methionyl-tRNA formyltransferase
MRTVLVGAVESTRVALETLATHGVLPAAVFTLPRSESRRHADYVDLRPMAARWNVPVRDVVSVNAPEVLDELRALEPTYALVIGWSQICRRPFLEIPRAGAIGFHPAPLPENRGRAVIPWTILQGRSETGSTLFWLDEGIDSGDILLQERFPVDPDEIAAGLYVKHLEALRCMLAAAIPLLQAGTAPRVPQDHSRATYCAKRAPADGLIDWGAPAQAVWSLIRAVGDPYPGAFSLYRGKHLFVWEADYVGDAPYTGLPGQVQAVRDEGALVQCGDGRHVLLKVVQVDGGPRGPAARVVRNHARLGINWLALHWRAHGGAA